MRISIWKFEPTASEARDNELPATSDSDWGGCLKTTGIVLRHAGSTMATMSRTQGSVSLSSAEAEYYGTVSALAEAKRSSNSRGASRRYPHHSWHGLISSQGKCRAPWMWKNEKNQCKVQVSRTKKYGCEKWAETQCCQRLDKDSASTSAQEHIDYTENRAVGTYPRAGVIWPKVSRTS